MNILKTLHYIGLTNLTDDQVDRMAQRPEVQGRLQALVVTPFVALLSVMITYNLAAVFFRTTLANKDQILTRRVKEVSTLQDRLAQLKLETSILRDDLARRQEEASALQEKLSGELREASVLREELARREKEASTFQEKQSGRLKEISSLREELARREKEASSLLETVSRQLSVTTKKMETSIRREELLTDLVLALAGESDLNLINGLNRSSRGEFERSLLIDSLDNGYFSVVFHVNKHQYDKAIDYLSSVIKIKPKASSAFRDRGIVRSFKQDYDGAISDFGEAMQLNPNDSEAYRLRGLAWEAKRELDKAASDFNEALRLDPNDASIYCLRARVWYKRQNYGMALADYGEAVRVEPLLAIAYSSRAWLWATCPDDKFRDGRKAVESATRACELTDWEDASTQDTLAAAYAESGDFDKAIEWQEKANKLYTDAVDKRKGEERLKLYKDKKPFRDETGK